MGRKWVRQGVGTPPLYKLWRARHSVAAEAAARLPERPAVEDRGWWPPLCSRSATMLRVQQLLLLLLFRGSLIDAGEWAVASAQGGLSIQCPPQIPPSLCMGKS